MLETNAALEIYSAIIVGVVWFSSYFFIDDLHEIRRYRRIPYVMFLVVILALLSDAYVLLHSAQQTFLFYFFELVLYATHFIILAGASFYCAKVFDIQSKKDMRLVYSTIPIAIIGFIVWASSLIFGQFGTYQADGYHRGPFYWFGAIPGGIIVCILFYMIFLHRNYPKKHVPIVMFLAVLIPILLLFYRTVGYQLQMVGIAFSIVLISLVIDLEQIQEKRKLEVENISANTAISLSQIKPHFLYNCITSISYLCEKDPMKAQEALREFSRYLRGNLNTIDNPRPISLTKELEHVKAYVALEQMRFGERVNVEYDIQDTDIQLPAMTLQPIVENAIKHGIVKKEEGGTVHISSYENDQEDVLCVEDNGVGFDSKETKKTGFKSIALNNIQQRLHVFCNGNLTVESTKGVGTKVTIHLPKSRGGILNERIDR